MRRAYICICCAISIGLIALAVFPFRISYMRLWESMKDFGLSIKDGEILGQVSENAKGCKIKDNSAKRRVGGKSGLAVRPLFAAPFNSGLFTFK